MTSTWTAAIVLFGLTSVLNAQQPESPREQLQQYVTQLQASPSDDALRTKIIQLALTLDPQPAIPGNAMEHEGAAEYAFKHAQSPADLTSAAAEYEQALLIAPWNAGDYYNLAVCYDKAGDPQKAIAAYQFYLLAAPSAKDADDVVKQIGALKYQVAQKRKQDQVQTVADAVAQARRQEEQRLEGRYIEHVHVDERRGSMDTDVIRDVQQGGVIAGQICSHATGVYAGPNEGRIGLYVRDPSSIWTIPIPVIGHAYHREEHYNNGGSTSIDGVISDDGSSITETVVGIYANGARYNDTKVYRRQ